MFNLIKIFIVMSTNAKTKVSSISVELMHRDGEVTLAASNGIVVTVRSNNIEVALGAIFAANMAAFHDSWQDREENFDIKMEVTTY